MNIIYDRYPYDRPAPKGNIAYVVIVDGWSEPVVKIGSSTRGTRRFADKNFPFIHEQLCVIEFDTKEEARNAEDFLRIALRSDKRFEQVGHDTFLRNEDIGDIELYFSPTMGIQVTM